MDCFILIQDLKAHSCLIGLEIGKMLCAKPLVPESSLCHKHAVTMLIQPGHINEQLKWRLKSKKEENRNFLIISNLSCQGIALHKGKQDEVSNFKQLQFL